MSWLRWKADMDCSWAIRILRPAGGVIFHDAVRLSTENPDAAYAKEGRLSVEHLSYDLTCLRYLMDHPVAPLSHVQATKPTPKSVVKEANAVVERAPRYASPPPKVRAEIAEKYKSYTVLFAAIFAERRI